MSDRSPPLALPLAQLIDEAAERFEEACRAGNIPRVEDFFADVSLEAQPVLLRELLRVEADYRRGPPPPGARADYIARLTPLGDWAAAVLDEFFPPTSGFTVTLTVIDDPHANRAYTFDRHDTFVVGRGPDVHFSLPDDPYFSRAHFLVEVNPPLCHLTDLRSKNGVLVNGKKVQTADLVDGDEIRGGKTALKVAITRSALPLTLPESSATKPPLPPTVLPGADAPTVVPGYRLISPLGQGGMGVVYLAENLADGSLVALKTIRPAVAPTEATLGRFRREVAVLRKLRHPHIVAFRDAGETGGILWFAMEFVNGTDAAALVRREGPLPVGRAVRFVGQVLDALRCAHAEGIVHRDVKPSNILVTNNADGEEMAKLADFGLARAYQESQMSGLTMAGLAGGTPGFMPPEQILDFRSAKPAADQYAAAATLYFLLSGDYPFGICRGVDELFQKVLTDDPVPLSDRRADLPAELAAAVMRALARKPEARFRDVVELQKVLAVFTD